MDDNLLIRAKRGPRGDTRWTLRTIYDAFPLLAGMRGRMAGRLSGGEQQTLAIARAPTEELRADDAVKQRYLAV